MSRIHALLACTLLTLAAAAQQTFVGTTPSGGGFGAGAIYSVTNTGTYEKLHDFQVLVGSKPESDIVFANGKYYGTTRNGGAGNVGLLFSFDPGNGDYAVLADFALTTVGGIPQRGPTLANNGKLYGVNSLRSAPSGSSIYEYDLTTGTLTNKVNLPLGSFARCQLEPDASGNLLYGVTKDGNGRIFSYSPGATTYTTVHSFTASQGIDPDAGLIFANGSFYGTCSAGGSNGGGTLFRYTPGSGFTKLHDFAAGSKPAGELAFFDGKLFGTTETGGASGLGTVFRYDLSGASFQTLKEFEGGIDGSTPRGRLTYSPTSDVVLGMTSTGGVGEDGILFQISTSTLDVIKLADLDEGGFRAPLAGLTEVSPGVFAGTSTEGGTVGQGSLFLFSVGSQEFEELLGFSLAEGQNPDGRLLEASNGLLYGTTRSGGSGSAGILYSFDRATGIFQRLFNFSGANGQTPVGDLIEVNGQLYGVCETGGALAAGTLFRWNLASSTFTKVLDFSNSSTGGAPKAGLTLADNGKIYGTTTFGPSGSGFQGTLFEYDPAGSPTLVIRHQFTTTDGTECTSPMLKASSGSLFGVCTQGGQFSDGSLFEFIPSSNTFIRRHSFEQFLDAANPSGKPVQSSNGFIWGTCSGGASQTAGAMWRWNPFTNDFTPRADFGVPSNDPSSGDIPFSGVVLGSDGSLYGTCSEGGTGQRGTFFSYNTSSNSLSTVHSFSNVTGGAVYPTTAAIPVSPISLGVTVNVKVLLDGPYQEGSQTMSALLRTRPEFPLTEPYTGLGYPHVGGGGESTTPSVLSVSGNNAVVDWVVIELRSSSSPSTVVATRAALLQSDGDVVDVNGSSPVSFGTVAAASYHVAVRHRNHLGAMTQGTVALSASPVLVDLTSGGTATFGTNARRVRGSKRTLWAGDAITDKTVRYSGAANDRAQVLSAIGTIQTNTTSGYFLEDVNLDGDVKYRGTANDGDAILRTIGGINPAASVQEQLP